MSVEALGLIARVRRGMPRNLEVMELCDGYEKVLVAGRTRAPEVPQPIKAPKVVPDKVGAFLCERCERQRVAKAAEMKRYRARRKQGGRRIK